MLVSGIAQSGQNLALSRLAINDFVKRRMKLEQIKVAQNLQTLFRASLKLSEFEE